MSLRTRILLSVGLTLLALVAGITLVSSRLILQRFTKLEREDTRENITRAGESFEQIVNEVHVKSADWGSWNDAYAFMANHDRAFIESNLVPKVLKRMQLDAILFVGPSGRLFEGMTVSREDGARPPRADDVLEQLRLGSTTTSVDGYRGLIRLPDGPMLVSVRPILTSNEEGPSRGWLVFCRTFRGQELGVLRGLTRLDLAVERLGDAPYAGPSVQPLDQNRIAGHAVLRDLDGKPSLVLTIEKSRAIYQEGVASVSQVQLLIVLSSLAFGTVALFVLERFALSRLANLSVQVAAISTTAGEVAVHISGHDELSRLGEGINSMLAKMRESEQRLQAYNENLINKVEERTREMEHQAFHDKLTGLPNRALFTDRISYALSKAVRTRLGTAAFFLDLDNFKIVNDSLGHAVGDTLLVTVAERLAASVRPGDTVARLGGDEFTVLLEDLEDPQETELVARRILASLRAPIVVDGHEIFAGASIGIAYTAGPYTSPEILMKNADTAMYVAKANGKSTFVFYDESMNDHAVERLEMETGLRKALERGEIEVYYQPLIDLATGELRGAEALARWTSANLGSIGPGQFIPVAEETGLIVPIGYWILEEACRQAVEWLVSPLDGGFTINVNLSGKQLQYDDVVERVAEILRRTGLPPIHLKLEITESVLMTDHEAVIEKMHGLKGLGIKLALDDFGTGYSSLSTLGSFPVDTLKIDQAFISRLGEEEEAASIVEAIMTLSRSMKMNVTGEGVETFAQLRSIQSLGCHTGQGYLFDKPLSPRMFAERLIEEAGLRWAA